MVRIGAPDGRSLLPLLTQGAFQLQGVGETELLEQEQGGRVGAAGGQKGLGAHCGEVAAPDLNAEDTALITRVQEGMRSGTFSAGPLGASEVCLRNFARRMRTIIPEAREAEKPSHIASSP